MVNALSVSELAVHVLVPSKQATAAPPAKPRIISCEIGPADRQAVLDLTARSGPFEDGMIIVSALLPERAAESDAGP